MPGPVVHESTVPKTSAGWKRAQAGGSGEEMDRCLNLHDRSARMTPTT
jgi:hypothetical protein